MVGDIEFDAELDNSNFKLCNGDERVLQYFWGDNDKYVGEKIAVDKHFKTLYKTADIDESGLIRIRFVVNCNGEADRFRITQMNENYKEFNFDKQITNQLLKLTKSIEKWPQQKFKDTPIDYYHYLIFKIEKGRLIEILP